MTQQEMVHTANALARLLYACRGYQVPIGYCFDVATHPHEKCAWNEAVIAMDFLLDIDVEGELGS